MGGSISGLSTASSIKQKNKSIKVVVHEKHKLIGYNHEGRRCGEAHSIESEWDKWIPKGKSVFNNILSAEVEIGYFKRTVSRDPGTAFILNRPEFICQLAKDAENYGVEIQTNDKIKSISDLDGDFIIDASGCPSSIKRELGFDKGIKGMTLQHSIEDSNYFIPNKIKVIFDGKYGYYWIFPRNPEKREVNVGFGTCGIFDYNMKELLEDFKKKYNIQGKTNYVVGGLVPLGLQRPFMYKNILFVGDAGVGTFPFSGQGIYRALLSGDIAGKCIAKGITKKYPYLIYQAFIKWQVFGLLFYHINNRFRKINPELVLSSLRNFGRFVEVVHI
ncbi:hypothetical protein AYK24_08605 [Thermoplasmatales archaeon SG8-52-4]|nr:MAG: hypothetical protein AYK24_08605 [Thermoplasmatales archaeon SG8-52-4]